MNHWLFALGATMLMQLVASFMGQSLPVIAPLIMASTGLAPERVGNLSSLTALATVLYLMIGGVFLARMGPVRMLQLGTAMAVTALLVASLGQAWAIFLAAFMLGLGYGPTPPAGSRMLAATAPPAHRSLIFSIKQAGAPAGGALAGLIAAPVALAYGWPAALMLAFGVGVLAILVIQPLRPAFDAERNRAQRLRFSDIFSARAISAPLAAFKQNPVLKRVTALSVSFAICQGCLFSFTVTWLVEKRGFDLVLAGSVFAAMQFAGVVARILLGWVADRTGNALANLVAHPCLGAVAGGFRFLAARADMRADRIFRRFLEWDFTGGSRAACAPRQGCGCNRGFDDFHLSRLCRGAFDFRDPGQPDRKLGLATNPDGSAAFAGLSAGWANAQEAQLGGRFSLKAAMPSRASSPDAQRAKASAPASA
jgi:MFS family permease